MQPPRMPPRGRRCCWRCAQHVILIAFMLGRDANRWKRWVISAFVVFHVASLCWWHLGVVEYVPEEQRREDDFWRRARAVVAAVDVLNLRSVLTEYVRLSGNWQIFIMFGPDSPHDTHLIEVLASKRVDAGGRPMIDPRPVWSVHQRDVLDFTQAIGLLCSWRTDDTRRWRYIRKAYAHFRTEEAERARGETYTGIHFACHLKQVQLPGYTGPEAPWRKLELYDGPIDRRWYEP
jgi:hypothetical protein